MPSLNNDPCTRPASTIDLDHRHPWPSGQTTTENLQPLCRRHHQVKHSEGFGVRRNDDGSTTTSIDIAFPVNFFGETYTAAWVNNNGNIMASPWEARPRGKSGIVATDLFPQLSARIDDFAVIRSMTSKASEHAQGNYFFHTGFAFSGHPSAGAWMSYGLGSLNENLPAFVVLRSGEATAPHGGTALFSSGYLPAQHQASILKVDAPEPLANITPRQPDVEQRKRLELVRKFDDGFLRVAQDAQVEAAIRNYETAYRMQSAVPELCDLKGESEAGGANRGARRHPDEPLPGLRPCARPLAARPTTGRAAAPGSACRGGRSPAARATRAAGPNWRAAGACSS